MGTTIRPEVSEKKNYWIPKHRYYELKHFCMQYPIWVEQRKHLYSKLPETNLAFIDAGRPDGKYYGNSYVGRVIETIDNLDAKIYMIIDAARASDEFLMEYIIEAVTTGVSYTFLRTKKNIPCSRNVFYETYRKFFYILSKSRG